MKLDREIASLYSKVLTEICKDRHRTVPEMNLTGMSAADEG